jgi:hypothetical protein
MLPLRLVIDTNVVVSAALKPDGLQRTVPLLALTKPARLYGSFEDNVTADLVHLRVLPSPAQGIREMHARRRREGSSCYGQNLVADEMEANSLRP